MTITVTQSVGKIVFPNTDAVADPVTREAFDVLRRVIRTLTNTVTVSGTLNPDSGGTGITTYTIGDLIYASGATTLSKLADVAVGSVLKSGGVGVAPSWGALTNADIPSPLTGKAYFQSQTIDSGDTLTVPTGYSFVVAGPYVVTGDLVVNGDMVIV